MQVVITTNANDVAIAVMGIAEALSAQSISDWFKSKVDPIISTSILKNFQEEGRPRWASLSTNYSGYRPNTPILVVSGRLRDMFRGLTGRELDGGYGRLYPADTDKVDYYKYHQLGTSKMPQREIVGLQTEDINEIKESLGDWIESKALQAGWR